MTETTTINLQITKEAKALLPQAPLVLGSLVIGELRARYYNSKDADILDMKCKADNIIKRINKHDLTRYPIAVALFHISFAVFKECEGY